LKWLDEGASCPLANIFPLPQLAPRIEQQLPPGFRLTDASMAVAKAKITAQKPLITWTPQDAQEFNLTYRYLADQWIKTLDG